MFTLSRSSRRHAHGGPLFPSLARGGTARIDGNERKNGALRPCIAATAVVAFALLSSACADPHYNPLRDSRDRADVGDAAAQTGDAAQAGDAAPSLGDASAFTSAGGPDGGADAIKVGSVDDAAASRVVDGSTGPGEGTGSDAASVDPSSVPPDSAQVPPDAGSVSPVVVPPLAPGIPSWAPSLSGRFAMQVVSFSATNGAVVTYRNLMLGDVQSADGTTELVTQSCDELSTSTYAVVHTTHPEKRPARRSLIVFTADSFSTDADETLGYDAAAPAECTGMAGKPVAKRAFQTWITGPNCVCPGDALPPENDCRVTDPDEDHLAGYSVLGNTLQLGDSQVYGVTHTITKYRNGKPTSNGGFAAQDEWTLSSLQYGCRPSGCVSLTGTTTSCGTAPDAVLFVPLAGRSEPAGGWTCETLLQHAGELFPDPPPAMPPSCM
jgi:hypothetical protein